MFFKKSVILFFLALAVMKNLLFGFLIEIWYSFHKSFSHWLLKLSFLSRYKSSVFARKIFFGNLALSDDHISMKKSKTSFLTLGHFLGAPAPTTRNLFPTALPSISNFPVTNSSSYLLTNYIHFWNWDYHTFLLSYQKTILVLSLLYTQFDCLVLSICSFFFAF